MTKKLWETLKEGLVFEVIGLIFLVIIGGGYYFLVSTPPWKVTNPYSPQFNAEHFKFSDYKTTSELDEALRIILPFGTPKAKVDQILYQNQILKAGHLDGNGESTAITQSNSSGAWKLKSSKTPVNSQASATWGYFYNEPFTWEDKSTINIYVDYDKNYKVTAIFHNNINLLSPEGKTNE